MSEAPTPQSSGLFAPPSLPADRVYTSFYCEENIYLLAQYFHNQVAQAQAQSAPREADVKNADWLWDIYVIFISNDGKTVRPASFFRSFFFFHAHCTQTLPYAPAERP